ncbi:MAG: hypothetical protein LBP26_07810 [Clostridiales bacterium]|jgi:hypothetical protein|nr:hypothetical protein [Clostridiales bacterium]
MKKKIIVLVAAALLAASALLSGCGAGFSKIKIKSGFEQNTDYVVYGNGGMSVQYGDFIYFINGTRGFDDTDGKQNLWGGPVKGALYKAKLNGKKEGREFIPERVEATGLELVSYKGTDYADGETEIDIVDVQLVAPKVIGTSGYKQGGLFVYDDYIYYASPNNTKDKSGAVQTLKTDFMRTRLDGGKTQLIFTTEEDSADKPYAFYKRGNSVFLVCYYGKNIVSVEMKAGKKPSKPMLLASNATAVYFPQRDVYDSANNPACDPEDFIYYTRDVTPDDSVRTGNIAIAMRPDGSERFAFLSGATFTFEAVRGGALFYRTKNITGYDVIKFTNLHNALYEHSQSYKAYEDSRPEGEKRSLDAETLFTFTKTDATDYSSVYCYRADLYTNVAYMLGFNDGGVRLVSNGADSVQILAEAATLQFIDGNYMYFTDSAGTTLYRTEYTLGVAEKSYGENDDKKEKISHADLVSGPYPADLAAGYVIYFARVDEWADGYAFFKKIGGGETDAVPVYVRASSDEKPPEGSETATADDSTTDPAAK